MQGDVAMHLHREVLSLPIFDNASQGCRKAIAMQITPTFCTPGEYVLHCGDAVSGIYCVCNGSMEVLRDGMVVAILGNRPTTTEAAAATTFNIVVDVKPRPHQVACVD